MADTNIAMADYGNMGNTETKFSIDAATTDGISGEKETRYINNNWAKQYGYYKKIPEIKATIDAGAAWTIGKGYTSNPITEMMLGTIKGWGNDTFNSILENLDRVKDIGGDSYAHIIRYEGQLINVKPLDPSTMVVVSNSQGIITGYEQISRTNKPIKKFKPEEIFHLSRNRTADETHGESLIDAVEEIILKKNEAMTDMKTLMHRHVKPIFVYHLDTDDPTQIASIKRKGDAANERGENLYVPKGVVTPELLAVAPNATLNPLPWLAYLDSRFTQVTGVPDVVMGGSGSITDAAVKVTYLAWEQTVSKRQLYLKEQVLAQLNLEINLEFPASLESGFLSSKQKEGEEVNPPQLQKPEKVAQPNDLLAEMEGRK